MVRACPLLAWKSHDWFVVWCVLLGSLAATGPPCGGVALQVVPHGGAFARVCGVGVVVVGWWFENWIVDASIGPPRGGWGWCSYCDSNPRDRFGPWVRSYRLEARRLVCFVI